MRYKGKGGIIYNLESSPFAQGGEGKVFNIIGKPNMVAKLYKNGLNDVSKERKLLVMVNNPPSKAVMSQIAWPLDVLYDGSNTFVGFVMPKLAINEDLNVIYEYGTSSKYPNVSWSNKIIIAKNLCAVLDAVHEAGHVVGDLNPKNISVDPKTGHIVFVDTDSYHIEDNGSIYRCNVGMPEYLPVEIQKKMKGGLTAAPLPTFTKETDNFALAIHIFQLLMNGTHPFSCRVLPSQASVVFPQPSDNIMNGDFPFINPRSGTSIPVFAPPLSILPKEMQELFKRAFVVGHTNPKQRPTPEAWYNALTNLERQLKKCGRVSHHEYYSGLSQCPWCTADQNFTQGVATAKKTPMVQSTFSKGITPAYVLAPKPNINSLSNTHPNVTNNNSSVPMGGYSYGNDSSIFLKMLPFIYLMFAIASMAIAFIVVEWVVLILGVVESIIYFVLFNPNRKLSGYRDEYSIVEIVIVALSSITLLVLFDVYVEYILPKMAIIRDMIGNGTADISYYEAVVREIKSGGTVVTIVLIAGVIAGCVFGYKTMASMVTPLAVLTGSTIWLMIANALIDLPNGVGDTYDVSDFLSMLIGGVVLAIPSLIVAAIIWFIAFKVSDM